MKPFQLNGNMFAIHVFEVFEILGVLLLSVSAWNTLNLNMYLHVVFFLNYKALK